MNKSVTLKYYEDNAKALIQRYDGASMQMLHELFSKYITSDSRVLDIGFGSGRDMRFIGSLTRDVYGLEACRAFIKNMKGSVFEKKVAYSKLPDINIEQFQDKTLRFDVIISIAVWMHLQKEQIEQTIVMMQSILKQEGIVIISYSLKRDLVDERIFNNIIKEEMDALFAKESMSCILEYKSEDTLHRKIVWITQVFKKT